jgi:hypothetical protein
VFDLPKRARLTPGPMVRGRARWIVLLAAVLFSLLVLALLWPVRQHSPVSIAFDRYERSGLSNYALLLITNNSATPMTFNSFNTSPEGTIKHLYSLQTSNGWTAPQEFKPRQPETLFQFIVTLEPHESKSVRVPVDETERKVAIPFYIDAQDATPAQERFKRVRFIIRQFLGLSNDVGNVFWCPVSLRAEPKRGSSQRNNF